MKSEEFNSPDYLREKEKRKKEKGKREKGKGKIKIRKFNIG